jgi:hypothetical protein
MLDKLRSSPLDVNLLARTFESVAGKTRDEWQLDVLKLWYKDGAGPTKASTAYLAPSLS